MKYRFRVSKKAISPHTDPVLPSRRRRLRLRGADKLRSSSRLLEPIEEILLDLGAAEGRRRRRGKRFQRWWSGLSSRFRRFRVARAAGISLLYHRAKSALRRVRRKKRKPSIRTLPILAGALCASLLVTAVSAGSVLLGLFSGYGRSYRSITIPDFVGKEPSSVLVGEDSHIDLIIQYEKNDLVADGLVISQTPHAGVRRRLYQQKDYCTVTLTVSRSEDRYTLEELSGECKRDASLTLRNAGIYPKVREEYSDTVPCGQIIGTLPLSGTVLNEGDTVILRVSLGRKLTMRTVPNLFGVTEARANAMLRAASLTAGSISYQSSSFPAGTVIAQSIASGEQVEDGVSVSFTVSAGDRYSIRTVPDLYGMTLQEAENRLREYGLVIGSVYPVGGMASRGTVTTQSPLPGAPITSSTVAVDIYVIS